MESKWIWVLVSIVQLLCKAGGATESSADCTDRWRRYAQQHECSNYSCRDKCNQTMQALQEQGTTGQACSCDEDCLFFDDCCFDFPSACIHVLTNSVHDQKETTTSCINGVVVIDGAMTPGNTELSSLSTVLLSSLSTVLLSSLSTVRISSTHVSPVPDLRLDASFSRAPAWIKRLFGDIVVVDRTQQLAFVSMQLYRKFALPGSIQVFPLLKGTLEFKEPVPVIWSLFRDEKVDVQTLHFQEPVRRRCSEKQLVSCPGCLHNTKSMAEICFMNGNSTLPSLQATPDPNSNDCYRYRYPTRDDTHTYSHASVTIQQQLEHPHVVAVRSDHAPWSVLKCLKVQDAFDIWCSIQRCAEGRIMSPDGKVCFIPSHLSILVVNASSPTQESSSSEQVSSTSSTLPPSSSPPKKEDQSWNKIFAPPGLCLALYQLLQRHSHWQFSGIWLHDACRFPFKFKTGTKLRSRDGDNSGRISNDGSGPQFRPQSDDEAEDEYGMLQAWELVDAQLDPLAFSENFMILEVCFEVHEEETKCVQEEQQEDKGSSACENPISRCFRHDMSPAPTLATSCSGISLLVTQNQLSRLHLSLTSFYVIGLMLVLRIR